MLISCIIPTRNRPDFLIAAANSVLAQTHERIELIIVNDGTVAISPLSDSRVTVLNSGQAGAVPARNLGVSHARGEAIAWLDDDDVWTDPNFLRDAIDAFRMGIPFAFGDGELVFPSGERKGFARDAGLESLKSDNTILISAVCYQKSLHDTLGLFDEALPYYWDWDWYLRVARAGHRLMRISHPVVDIRIHAQNMSGQANEEARQANLGLLERKHGLAKIPLKSHMDFV
jgi:glycosyltransferase involved in cell wall biosynthesis